MLLAFIAQQTKIASDIPTTLLASEIILLCMSEYTGTSMANRIAEEKLRREQVCAPQLGVGSHLAKH